MPYDKTVWENKPSKATPISADALNNLETQYDKAVLDASVEAANKAYQAQLNAVEAAKADAETKYALKGALDIRNYYNVNSPPANFDAVFAQLVADSNVGQALGAEPKPIFLPAGYTFNGEFSAIDKSLVIYGGGTLVQRKGRGVVRVTATPAQTNAVTYIGTINLSAKAQAAGVAQLGSYRVLAASSSFVSSLAYGDQCLLESEDAYPGLLVTGSTRFTFKRGWVHVDGLLMDVDVSGTLVQDDFIVGTTSGATGYAAAVNDNLNSGKTAIVFRSVTGSFISGETFRANGVVSGTVSSAPLIITGDKLEDTTYSTNPKLRKVNKSIKVDIDVSVKSEGDYNEPIGAAARKDAIVIEGCYDPRVTAHFYSGYGRGVSYRTCRAGSVTFTGGNLPNNPSTEEGAFGYGVEVMAATEDTVITIHATNLRHGVTTNCIPQDSQPTDAVQSLRSGVPKNVLVKSSVVHNSLGASFDTHAGAWNTMFLDCVSYYTGSGGQNAARDVGFANRAFGTIFKNCVSFGAVFGFQDSAYSFATPAANTIRIDNCRAIGFLQSGYRHGTETAGANMDLGATEYVITDFYAEAKTMPLDAPFRQSGIDISTAKTTVYDATVKGANFAAVNVRTSPDNLALHNIIMDQFGAPAAGSGAGWVVYFAAAIRFSRRANVTGLTAIDNEGGTAIRSLLASASGVTVKIRRPLVATGKFSATSSSTTLYTSQTGTPTPLDSTNMTNL